MTFEEAEQYVNQVRWQYAKTYPTAPHEYTCLDWDREKHAQMVDFAYFVKINGYTEIFGKCAYRCLNIGEFKYWTMDDPWDKTDLINRTFVDDSRRWDVASFVQSPKFQYFTGMSLTDVVKQQQESMQKGVEEFKKRYEEDTGKSTSDLFGGNY